MSEERQLHLPAEGSGDEQSPEWLQRQLEAYATGLVAAFSDPVVGVKSVRRAFRDFTAKNCEEAWAGRGSTRGSKKNSVER